MSEFNWSAFDFFFFGALVLIAATSFFLVLKKSNNRFYKIGAGVALATSFILIWINGAVGIIGSENDKANIMYVGVLAVGILGSLLSRFKALGLFRTMIAMAIAQELVTGIAVFGKMGASSSNWPIDLIALNTIFSALWITSALLFKKSAN